VSPRKSPSEEKKARERRCRLLPANRFDCFSAVSAKERRQGSAQRFVSGGGRRPMSAPVLFVWIVERARSGNIDVSRRHAFVTMVQPAAHRKRGELDGSTHHPGLLGGNGSASAQRPNCQQSVGTMICKPLSDDVILNHE